MQTSNWNWKGISTHDQIIGPSEDELKFGLEECSLISCFKEGEKYNLQCGIGTVSLHDLIIGLSN